MWDFLFASTDRMLAVFGFSVAWIAVWRGARFKKRALDAQQLGLLSEKKLLDLMELSGDWYWQQNTEHALTHIVFRGQHGPSNSPPDLPLQGLIRWHVPDLRCVDDRYDWNTFRALLDRKEPFDRVCFEYWPPDRPRLIFESTGRPIYSKGQLFQGYMGVSTDLTQKKLNEHMLSLQRSFLQGVLLSVPFTELMASYAQGLKNCLTHHAEVILGYRDRANNRNWHVRGSSSTLRIPQDKGNDCWKHIEQYCEALEGYEQTGLIGFGRLKPEHYFESTWEHEHGIHTVWVATHKAVEENQPEYWVLIAQKSNADIMNEDVLRVLTGIRLMGLGVERRVFEDDLQALNANLESLVEERTEQLKRSNAELEAFAYTVSHDLRAPLRAIAGFSKVLMDDFETQLPEQANTLLQRIHNNTKQMSDLINGLLEFAKLLKTELMTIEVDQQPLLDQVLEQLNVKGCDWVHVSPLPPVQADPILLRQVWVNLIDNAIKFSAKVETPSVRIACERLPTAYRFSVEDNGAGFDSRYANKLFNVFERLHFRSEFDGTGVGLAIVRRIVERHGGEVFASSGLGKGATFGFTLPCFQ